MACNHENNSKEEQHIEVKTISFTSEEDDPEPPPPTSHQNSGRWKNGY
jgi:hypothetical protein